MKMKIQRKIDAMRRTMDDLIITLAAKDGDDEFFNSFDPAIAIEHLQKAENRLWLASIAIPKPEILLSHPHRDA